MRFYCTDMPSVTRWPDGDGVEEYKTDKRQNKVMNDTVATVGPTQRETCPDMLAGPTALP